MRDAYPVLRTGLRATTGIQHTGKDDVKGGGDDVITFDYNYFMADAIGNDHGITERDLLGMKDKASAALSRMERERKAGMLGFLEIPFDDDIVRRIAAFRESVAGKFTTVALIGIGGSALGPQAIKNALAHLYHNELSDERRGGACRLYFFDNVDPYEINALADIIDVTKTLFLVISKSGGTTETNANFAILFDMLKKKVGGDYVRHIVAITDPESGVLRKIADMEKFASFPVPPNVGGRFSVLTAVGLVASAFLGIDIAMLLKGARGVMDAYYGVELLRNAPLLAAACHYLFDTEKDKRINVLMPYTRKLFLFADWYRQLWAESLGKSRDIDGKPAVRGLTPVPALGTIDQHSQLQLYLEGPNDKVITFLKLDSFDTDITIPEFYTGIPEMEYLSGTSLRELNRFEESATELALKDASRPNASLTLPRLDAESVGALIMFMEMQTAYAGYLYNINPYDQPAVEQGKKFTFGLLNRPGYESFREQFERGYTKTDKYVI